MLSFLDKARRIVYMYATDHLEKTDTHPIFSEDEVYVVWFCKTLQNWKALLSTTLPDGMYYEVTFDGDKQMVYLDAYKKFNNVALTAEVVDYATRSPGTVVTHDKETLG